MTLPAMLDADAFHDLPSARTPHMEMTPDLAGELEATMDRMMAIFRPFSEPGTDWSRGGRPLQDLVERRDAALIQGKPITDRFRQLWSEWESTTPAPDERARIFQARNRIVELGMSVSKSDTAIQTQLKRKSDDLRRQALESGRKAKALQAYLR
jgi:hypothetical protein